MAPTRRPSPAPVLPVLFLLTMTACQGLRWMPAVEGGTERLVARDGARTVAVYRAAASPCKPYVEALCTPAGVQVLRDAPHDHLHHHGLMFAVRADGTNFWEENDHPGCQLPRATDADHGRLRSSLAWMTDDGIVLLDERRELLVTASPELTRLTWRTALTPAAERERVVLSGAHYHGLGMRFVEAMDGAVTFLHPAGAEGEVVRGTERWTPGPWAACLGTIDGRDVTVVMASHPDSERPTLWFTMSAPFAYLAATCDGWRAPVTLRRGEVLEFVHAVLLFDGQLSAAQIRTHYDRWLVDTVAPRTR